MRNLKLRAWNCVKSGSSCKWTQMFRMNLQSLSSEYETTPNFLVNGPFNYNCFYYSITNLYISPVISCELCGNKMPTRRNGWFLLQILLLPQHVSGTIMSIIRSSRVLYRWLLPVVFGVLVFKLLVWCGAEGYVSGLRAATASFP